MNTEDTAVLATKVNPESFSLGNPDKDKGRWRARFKLKKWFDPNLTQEDIDRGNIQPDEEYIADGNLLSYGGTSVLWEALIGSGTGTAAQALTYFNNGNAAIGVGDSSTAAAATQTDLQASSNKFRAAMMSTYPQHTDATTSGSATILFQSSFGSGNANFAWNEVGVFNSATLATGRMLNRVAQSFGTKSSGVWQIQVSITIS